MATNQALLYTEQHSTENRATPEDFHADHARLSRLFETAPLGVGKLTPGGRWLQVTDNLCRMLGYTRSQLLKKTVEDVTHPQDWLEEKALLAKILDGKEDSYEIEKRYICHSGRSLSVTETVAVVRDDTGAWLDCSCLIRVNELKRIQELFELTVELSSNAMAMTDERGKIILVNRQIEKIFGYRQSELLGKNIEVLTPGLLRERLAARPANLQVPPIEGKSYSPAECKDGTVFPVEVTLRAGESGRGTWILASIMDMRGQQQEGRTFLTGGMSNEDRSAA